MPHVSSKKLKKDQLEEIFKKLALTFNKVGAEKKSKIMLDEFLTQTEKIMLAKRLAIIFMLNEKISTHYISEVLLVSPSTVERMSLKNEHGDFSYISKIVKSNSNEIWEVIKPLIGIFFTPKVGKSRWKWFYEIDKKYYKR